MTPTDELLAARRELHALGQYKLLEDLEWRDEVNGWVLKFQLRHDIEGPLVPKATDWYVIVGPEYPRGKIEVYPALQNGLELTFPHQNYNEESQLEWRMGKLCLEEYTHALGRTRHSNEPTDFRRRLLWHVDRAIQWLEHAASGHLLAPGHPFEIPTLPKGHGKLLVASYEDEATLSRWTSSEIRQGVVLLSRVNQSTFAVRSFRSPAGAPIVETAWGSAIGQKPENAITGVWVRFDRLPVVDAWHLPYNWKDLVAVCEQEGIDLMDILKRAIMRPYAGQIPTFLLLGSPIPMVVGDSARHVHWHCILLPEMPKENLRGWRKKPDSKWERYATMTLHPSNRLMWCRSENWNPDEISTRGRAHETLREQHVAIIGTGALGSLIAEAFCRLGVHNMLLVDGDELTTGNLVRHNLSVQDIGQNKAAALSNRLNSLSPSARVTHIPRHFPSTAEDSELLQNCSIIVDCTADDAVLDALSTFDWGSTKLFLSCSVSAFAKRLYLYAECGSSLTASQFYNRLDSWIGNDTAAYKDVDFPWAGTGCWHPVFPARQDDFLLWSAIVSKQVENFWQRPGSFATFRVFEQSHNKDGTDVVRLREEWESSV